MFELKMLFAILLFCLYALTTYSQDICYRYVCENTNADTNFCLEELTDLTTNGQVNTAPDYCE